MDDQRFGLGVFVCIFNKNFSKILLIKRNEEKRKKFDADWGNVGGRIEFGEMSKDACIREAKEEICVNLDKERLKLIDVIENPFLVKNKWHSIHFVYTTTLDENTKFCLNDESEEIRWFDLDNLPDRTIDKKEDFMRFAREAKNNLSD